jgi:acyl-CoA thioesterase-1
VQLAHRSMYFGWVALTAAICLLMLCVSESYAAAAEVTIVAIGSSSTEGHGVPYQESYPAQLEAMLRAKGVDARVINAGIGGDTTGGMLARLDSAVPDGTRYPSARHE